MNPLEISADDRTKRHRSVPICTVHDHPQRPGEAQANARLIAHAPEMRQALIDLRQAMFDGNTMLMYAEAITVLIRKVDGAKNVPLKDEKGTVIGTADVYPDGHSVLHPNKGVKLMPEQKPVSVSYRIQADEPAPLKFYFDQATSTDYGFPYDNEPEGKPLRQVIHSTALLRALGDRCPAEVRTALEGKSRDLEVEGKGFGWWQVVSDHL